jgi:hypothetical protein
MFTVSRFLGRSVNEHPQSPYSFEQKFTAQQELRPTANKSELELPHPIPLLEGEGETSSVGRDFGSETCPNVPRLRKKVGPA